MLLLRGGAVLTMDDAGRTIRDGAVLIDGDRIRAVGRADDLARAAPGEAGRRAARDRARDRTMAWRRRRPDPRASGGAQRANGDAGADRGDGRDGARGRRRL